jgi:hypothetical protein
MTYRLSKIISSILLAITLSTPTTSIIQAAQIPNLKQNNTASGKLHYLTIPAAAFHPRINSNDYEDHGRYLIDYSGSDSYYVAAVELPQGAQITKMTYFWKDPGAGETDAHLSRSSRNSVGLIFVVAYIPASQDTWFPAFGSSYVISDDFAIDEPVDNDNYNYFLEIHIPGNGQVWGCAVQIEYSESNGTAKPNSLVQTVKVTPAAFTPYSDGHDFSNQGWKLINYTGPSNLNGRGWYVAPVYLPEGVTLTGLIFHWRRKFTTTDTETAYLERSTLWTGNYEVLASASSQAGSGDLFGSSTDNSILGGAVSNTFYTYWVVLDLPNWDGANILLEAYEVNVQFTIPTSTNNILSIPAAAFQPYEDGYDYQNAGRSITHYYGPNTSDTDGWYLAPVSLPDGVLVTRLDFYWYENTTVAGEAHLQRTTLNLGDYQNLADAYTTLGSDSNGLSFDTSVIGGPVDNVHYAYWIVLVVPSTSFGINVVHPYNLRLRYNLLTYLPLVRR